MPSLTTSKVSRADGAGTMHTVHVSKSGNRRALRCETCGWRTETQFLPWLKADEHLVVEHGAREESGDAGGTGETGETGEAGEAGRGS